MLILIWYDNSADFKANGVDHLVTVRHRNVCARGFPVIEGGVDAVFLDLPTPWEVVESSKNILVAGGHFCSFSPCIEQVQRTCLALSARQFTGILILSYNRVALNKKMMCNV
jgi:tRNA (adenine57-N1/adenine58-N1)-methyltransferase